MPSHVNNQKLSAPVSQRVSGQPPRPHVCSRVYAFYDRSAAVYAHTRARTRALARVYDSHTRPLIYRAALVTLQLLLSSVYCCSITRASNRRVSAPRRTITERWTRYPFSFLSARYSREEKRYARFRDSLAVYAIVYSTLVRILSIH